MISVDLARQLSTPVLQERVSVALAARCRRQLSPLVTVPPSSADGIKAMKLVERFVRDRGTDGGEPQTRSDLFGRVPGLLRRASLDGRFEYVRTSRLSRNHKRLTDGY